MITVKNIFDKVSKINPDTNSYGVIDSAKEQIAQSYFNDIYPYIPAGTLAHKIIQDTIGRFTDKQLWVIAYELLKNVDYVASLNEEAIIEAKKLQAKNQEYQAKETARKEANADVLADIKNAGRKLTEYYNWVKNNKKYAREYYSKKYTAESVGIFLAA